MKQLKGLTIWIGKEPGHGRLLVAMKINGQVKALPVGAIGSVPNSVSRCLPADEVAHCSIAVNEQGAMTLKNLKPQNVTYVNGTEIASKRITPESRITLGQEQYAVDLPAVIDAAKQIVGSMPKQPGEYPLKPLQPVWDSYNNKLKEIKIRQKNIALLSSVPMAFSMFGGLIAGVAPEIRQFALVFTGIAVCIMLYGLYKRFTDKTLEETEQLTEQFQSQYVCPNPDCRHFLGTQPYKILRQNNNCPYCKCKFTDK